MRPTLRQSQIYIKVQKSLDLRKGILCAKTILFAPSAYKAVSSKEIA
jgi:hypothetical protein